MHTKVSVIIPTYNSEKFIQKTINAALNQDYDNFEIIVVDDGSIDNTLQIVNDINDKRLKLFAQKHRGVGAARNFGIEKSSGVFIAYCDHDDIYENNHLIDLAMYLDSHPKVGMVYSKSKRIDPEGNSSISDNLFNKNKLEYFCYITPSLVMHKKNCLDISDGWDTNCGESHADMDFFNRVSDNFEVTQMNSISVTRHVMRTAGGFVECLRSKNYFLGLDAFLNKRFQFFKQKKGDSILSPFDGYYFALVSSQILPQIFYGESHKYFEKREMFQEFIISIFKNLSALDSKNLEVWLAFAFINSLIPDYKNTIDVLNIAKDLKKQNLFIQEKGIKDFAIQSLKKILESINTVENKSIADYINELRILIQ